MAEKFMRSTRGVRDIDTLSTNLIEVTDVVSTEDGKLYIKGETDFVEIGGSGSDYDEQIKNLQSEITKLTSLNKNLTDKVDDLDTLSTSNRDRVTDLETKSTELETKYNDLETRIKALETPAEEEQPAE